MPPSQIAEIHELLESRYMALCFFLASVATSILGYLCFILVCANLNVGEKY